MSKKTGLKTKVVSKDSFSSRAGDPPKVDESRAVFRIVEGSHLLASDVETGKSDPVCFVWIGPKGETPDLEVPVDERLNAGIMLTSVCYTTIDPRWDEEIIFPLDTEVPLEELVNYQCLIYVRDEDINEDGSITYDELGLLEIPFKDIIVNGKRMNKNTSFVLSATWYALKKSPGMRKAEGDIKMTCTLQFGTADAAPLFDQLNLIKDNKSGTITAAPKDVAGFTEQLQAVLKPPPSRPTSAVRTRPLSASSDKGGDAESVAGSVATSRRPSSASKDGLGKKKMALKIRRSGPDKGSVMGNSMDLGAGIGGMGGRGATGMNMNLSLAPDSVVSNIDDIDAGFGTGGGGGDSVFGSGGSMLGVLNKHLAHAELGEEMDPILEDDVMYGAASVAEGAAEDDEGVAEAAAAPAEEAGDGDEDELVVIRGDEADASPAGEGEEVAGAEVAEGADPVAGAPAVPQKGGSPAEGGVEGQQEVGEVTAWLNNMDLVAPEGQIPPPDDNEDDGNDDAMRASTAPEDKVNYLQAFEKMPSAVKTNGATPASKPKPSAAPVAPAGAAPATRVKSANAALRASAPEQRIRAASAKAAEAQNELEMMAAGGNATSAARMLKEMAVQRHMLKKGMNVLAEMTKESLIRLTERIEHVERTMVRKVEAIRQQSPVKAITAADSEEAGAGKKGNTIGTTKSANARNVRPTGGIREYRKAIKDQFSKTERVVSELGEKFAAAKPRPLSASQENAFAGANTGDYVKGSASPTRIQQEISRNKFDPRFHNEVAAADNYAGISGAGGGAAQQSASAACRNDQMRGGANGGNGRGFGGGNTGGNNYNLNDSGFGGNNGGNGNGNMGGNSNFNGNGNGFSGNGNGNGNGSGSGNGTGNGWGALANENGSGGTNFIQGDANNRKRQAQDGGNMGNTGNFNGNNNNNFGNGNNMQQGNFQGQGPLARSGGNQWESMQEQLQHQLSNQLPLDPELVHNLFDSVLNRGSHDDFARLLKTVGPKPEILSFGMRSRTFDAIATLLMQGRNLERSLVWVLSLVRGKLVVEITQHTQRSLLDGLRKVAMERSRRGLLAGLLESAIHNQCSNAVVGNDFGMMLSTTSPTRQPPNAQMQLMQQKLF